MIGLVAISCKPIYQTQYIHTKDSVFNTIYDSIYIKEYAKNETIFIETSKIKYEYKYQYKVDTTHTTDTIVKYINRTTKVRQKPFKAYLSGIITAVLLVIGYIVYVKIFQNRRIH